jgi:hypothetical protein
MRGAWKEETGMVDFSLVVAWLWWREEVDKTKSEFTNRTDRDDKRSNMVVVRQVE